MEMDEAMEVVEMATGNTGNQNLIVTILVLLVAIVFVGDLINKVTQMFGIKNKWGIHEEQQNAKMQLMEREIETIKSDIRDLRNITTVREDKCTVFENGVSDTLNDIKDDLLHSKIEEYRFRILEFANNINKEDYNKEYYDQILEIYSDYESILQKNQLNNGKIEMAIQHIKSKYTYYQKNGFPIY